MVISYKWLSQYLPVTVPVDELAAILTSIGLEVEALETFEDIKGGLKGLVIGQVLTCEQHPNADKLKITTVDTGNGEPLKIVCGASNVAAGQKVVVATVGTTVYPTHGEAFQIKKAKIRGAESEGMICAEDEIGLGESHEGIMVLPETAEIGMSAATYFKIGPGDVSIHIGLTPNRSDAMSHIGVARDVCAYLSHHRGTDFKVVNPAINTDFNSTTPGLPIHIDEDAAIACPRYSGISISGVKVAESPEWLKKYLQTIGVRPINNVVDITNFVLHEYGQPLHAFDADKIEGKVIKVGFLPEGTMFPSLDGKERTLEGHDLVICDAEQGMCMAGVFGGSISGVSEHTTNIFLESAYFHPSYIRRTSLRHGLRTDAALHFEKGVDINNVIPALQRAADLIVSIAGGRIASSIADVYPAPFKPVTVTATYEYIQRLSGKQYSREHIRAILEALNFVVEHEDAQGITVIVPSNKTDVLQAADIVEEILRIDGLDNIEMPGRFSLPLLPGIPNDRQLREKAANALSGFGFNEIVTNSITNSNYYPGNEQVVRMLNSLSSELDILRPAMLESGLEVISYNLNRKNVDLAFYEFGNIYLSGGVANYYEEAQLALWITGNVRKANWKHKVEPADIFYAKSVITNLLRLAGIDKISIAYGDEGQVTWKWKNEVLCTLSKVGAERLKMFDIKQDVYFAAINWTRWIQAAAAATVRYSEVPKHPAVSRDLALVLDSGVSFEEVRQATAQLKIQSLKEFDIFDVFESDKLGAGKKSYALSYVFQLQDRTLTDAEVEQIMKQLINTYTTKLQAQIRG